MVNYFHEMKKAIIKDILTLLLYIIMSVWVVWWIVALIHN